MKTGIKLIDGYQTSETMNGSYASFVISSLVVSILLPTQKNRDVWAGFELWHFRYFSNLIINAKLAVAWPFLCSIIMQWCCCYAVPINAWAAVWGEKEFLSGNEEKTEDQVFYHCCVHDIFIRWGTLQTRLAWDSSEVLTGVKLLTHHTDKVRFLFLTVLCNFAFSTGEMTNHTTGPFSCLLSASPCHNILLLPEKGLQKYQWGEIFLLFPFLWYSWRCFSFGNCSPASNRNLTKTWRGHSSTSR